MDRAALEQLSKDTLIDLLLAQEARHAAELAVLREQNAALLARIDALERRLGLDSSNSSKPPSSDGLKKKPPLRTRSLRGKSGKARGGQVGHPGSTLKRSETPDTTIDHYPAACGGCGAPLTAAASTGHRARQVFDLPEPLPLLATEHRAHECQCAACGAKTQAAFPEGVNAPVQYGARIMSFVIYLLHFQLLPEKRLVMLMADLFSVFLSPGTIGNMSRACAARMGIFAQTVCDRVCAAPVKHLDETGFRIGGKLRWLHVASTRLLTFYRCRKKRGDMLANLTGIIVHDHWKSYFTLEGVQHALCNAHHLRELKALIEIEKETWAQKMQTLLRRACHATNLARTQDKTLSPKMVALIERRYDAAIAEGMAFHNALPPLHRKTKPGKKPRGPEPRRIGHNLLGRLQTHKKNVLRFLTDPTVPFSNNLAEGDIRMMKVRQKISGGFRSEEGADDFAIVRSLISTARKQGWNILEAIMAKPSSLIERLQTA